MKTYYLFLVFFSLVSCKSQNNERDLVSIRMNFYTSSGGNLLYSIILENNILIIKDLNPLNNNEIQFININLSDDELNNFKSIISKVYKRNDLKADIVLDSWRIEFYINNELYYNESGVNLDTIPKDIKNVLDLLTKNSKIKINLEGFS